jgi:septal ring factor EnvC (AmiA/AmiB activator)
MHLLSTTRDSQNGAMRRTFPLSLATSGLFTGLASGLALVICCGAASAQGTAAPPGQRGEVVRQLETSKDTLKQTERKIQTLQTDVQQLNSDQARINEQLIEIGRLAQQSEVRLGQIEGRVAQLDGEEKQIRSTLATRHEKIAKLFSAMQRMGRNPPPVIITKREDALQMVRSAMLLARAFPELKSQADELSGRLKDLVRVMAEARTEGERLKSESARLTDARTRLASLIEDKRRSVSDRQRELTEVRRSAAEIARSVNDLNELVMRLDKSVAQNTAIADYDRELKEREAREAKAEAKVAAAPPPSPPPALRPSEPAAVQAPPVRPSVVEPTPAPPATAKDTPQQVALAGPRPQPPRIELEPQGSFSANAGRMKPAIPFHLAKGQLPMPALGKKLISFGEKTQFGRRSTGLYVETRHGATVTSPVDGWVVYAGEFRSYGQVLIINAGGGYHILLAGLARTHVDVGRFLLAGEPVGAMSTNVVSKTQDNAPVLYIEFRNKEGQSFDPAPWWADRSQKVQG